MKDVVKTGQCGNGQIVRKSVFAQSAESAKVSLSNRTVKGDDLVVRILSVKAQQDLDLAACNFTHGESAELFLQKGIVPWGFDGKIAVSVIHRFNLYFDVKPLNECLTAAKTGHTFQHFMSSFQA